MINRRLFFLAAPLSVFIILPSCKVAPPKPPLVETVAILPFDNESNQVDADEIMQRFVYLAMKPSAYRVLDIKDVNDHLAGVGITDGGQLAAIDPTKLGKDLGVQALMFGYVESFGYTNIGVYVAKKVNLELKLVDVLTGQTLWENTGKGSTSKFAVDEKGIKANFARGLADQMADKVLKMPLEEEAKMATMKALGTLPGYQFCGFAADDQTPNGVRSGARDTIKSLLNKR